MIFRPYIGVTGVTSLSDVAAVADAWGALPTPAGPLRRLMCGVLVSARTLRGEATESLRYPAIGDVEPLCAAALSAGLWPVVHFNTREDLAFYLGALATKVPSMRGVQLNVVRPDRTTLAVFSAMRPDVEVILQVNRASLTWDLPGPCSPATARAYVESYAGFVAHALLDLSGGTGRYLDAEWCGAILEDATAWEQWLITPGVAGGLGPGCGAVLRALRRAINPSLRDALSVDAESGLRVPHPRAVGGAKHQDALCSARVAAYLRDATTALA